ncbi:MAG TPA: ferrochelatase [Bdellovibrionales bacterium]|nr:ferrochelatase [Bdellovibrionales bacterium]
MKTGILLLNVGTPDDPTPEKVGVYLKEFLMDPDVIDIPWPLRWILVNVLIVPKRSHASAEAYQKIWTERGSPLKFHMEDLCQRFGDALGDQYRVVYGMRYQNPSVRSALQLLKSWGPERILVVPLYPQYSLSSTASGEKEVHLQLKDLGIKTPVKFMAPFYRDPDFIEASASLIEPELKGADHLLMSFHGLPVKQIKKMDSSGAHCLARGDCCAQVTPANEKYCYRAQSYETARKIVAKLGWPDEKYTVAFQSRLTQGWIQPFTDELLPKLPKQGVKTLVVACPSFTTDCLETLEEIGLRAREQFLQAGGEELRLVPCLNAAPQWVGALSRMIQRI